MPCEVGENLFVLSASVGVTMQRRDDTAATMIERADAAVYQAKRRGRRRVELFDEELQERVGRTAQVELALRKAIASNELVLHLQPLADGVTGKAWGAEGLIRWQSPTAGLIPPNDFIPVAERSGLIYELERWVVHEAAQTLRRWSQAGHDELRLAINVSGRHILDGDFLGLLDEAFSDGDVSCARLEVELTESHLLDDVDRASAVLAEIRARGVRIAIDDFGTGYSSMTYLQRLPVDCVKIDRSFVAKLPDDTFGNTVVEAVISIAGVPAAGRGRRGRRARRAAACRVGPRRDPRAGLPPGAAGARRRRRAAAVRRATDRPRADPRRQSTGSHPSTISVTCTSVFSRPMVIASVCLARSIQRRSISVTSSSSSCSSSSRSSASRSSWFSAASTRSADAFVLPRRRAAVPALPSIPPSNPPLDLRPPSSPPRIEPAVDSNSEFRLLSACSVSTSMRSSAAAILSRRRFALVSYFSRQLGDLLVGAVVRDAQAPALELVGRFAGSAVELELWIGRDLDRQRARDVIAQVPLDRGPERLGVDLRRRQAVHGAVGFVDAQVTVVVVDLDQVGRPWLVTERVDDGLELLVVDEVGPGLVVAHRHAGHDRRLSPCAVRVAPDFAHPRGSDVDVAHGSAVRDGRHHRRFVVGQHRSAAAAAAGVAVAATRADAAPWPVVGGAGAADCRDGLSAIDRGDLVAGHGTAQVRHRPAGGEHVGLLLARHAQQELALAEPADHVVDRVDVDAAGCADIPSTNRDLSRSVWSRPIIHVPALEIAL